MTTIYKEDEGYEDLRLSHEESGWIPVFEHDNVFYRALQDHVAYENGQMVKHYGYLEIPAEPERSSFGTPMENARGVYPPIDPRGDTAA